MNRVNVIVDPNGVKWDFIASKTWSPKTLSDALQACSILFREAQLQGRVPAGHNLHTADQRMIVLPGRSGMFELEHVRTI